MIDAYVEMWKRFAEFKGRTSRSNYWFAFLMNFIVSLVLSVLFSVTDSGIFNVLLSIYSLAVFIPSLAMNVRRMHDINKSGWWILISLVPVVGGIWFIVLLATQGKEPQGDY